MVTSWRRAGGEHGQLGPGPGVESGESGDEGRRPGVESWRRRGALRVQGGGDGPDDALGGRQAVPPVGIRLAAPVLLRGEQAVGQDVADLHDRAAGAGIGGELAQVAFDAEAGSQNEIGVGQGAQVGRRGLERVGIDAGRQQARDRHLGSAHLGREFREHGGKRHHAERRGGTLRAQERGEAGESERPAGDPALDHLARAHLSLPPSSCSQRCNSSSSAACMPATAPAGGAARSPSR